MADTRFLAATGWYQIGYSGQVRAGEVRAIRFFGRSLVLFRTKAGELALLDGRCGHYGLPLAGGRVRGECIECPWHGWRWSVSGSLSRTPWAPVGKNARSRVGSWAVREDGGLVLTWYDADRQRPTWLWTGIPELSNDETGARLHSESREEYDVAPTAGDQCEMTLELLSVPSGAPDGTTIQTQIWGPGLGVVRLECAGTTVAQVRAVTPVGRGTTQFFSTTRMVGHSGGADGAWAPTALELVDALVQNPWQRSAALADTDTESR
jgi:nitrite reductase/ring-hydroxylating ferredoxin subunit